MPHKAKTSLQKSWIILTDKYERNRADQLLVAAEKRGLPVRLVSVYPRECSWEDAVANPLGFVMVLHQPRWSELEELLHSVAACELMRPDAILVAAWTSRYRGWPQDILSEHGLSVVLSPNEFWTVDEVLEAIQDVHDNEALAP